MQSSESKLEARLRRLKLIITDRDLAHKWLTTKNLAFGGKWPLQVSDEVFERAASEIEQGNPA